MGNDQRAWTRHGSTRCLFDDESIARAVKYVVEEQGAELDGETESR